MEDILCGQNIRGVVYITQKGRKTVCENVSGYADLKTAYQIRWTPVLRARLLERCFVASGILQLIAQGKIGFEDTIGKHLALDWHEIDREMSATRQF